MQLTIKDIDEKNDKFVEVKLKNEVTEKKNNKKIELKSSIFLIIQVFFCKNNDKGCVFWFAFFKLIM